MATLADVQGKIVVFAQGTLGTGVVARGTWDTTGAMRDDLLYAEELIDELAASLDLNADPARVLAAGFSMGGHFVHALGADTPATFRAIGVVSGFYGSTIAEPPPPPAGTLLPVFIVHGDADVTVPIAGGDPVAGGGLRLSADEFVQPLADQRQLHRDYRRVVAADSRALFHQLPGRDPANRRSSPPPCSQWLSLADCGRRLRRLCQAARVLRRAVIATRLRSFAERGREIDLIDVAGWTTLPPRRRDARALRREYR